ncbi:P63C domain-containing protein [Corynebacterium frankenforstense]
MTSHRGKLPKPDPRKVAGQKAADTRWGIHPERATHQGVLDIAGTSLDCYVLEDGRRIISQASIMATLGRSQSSGRRTRNDNRPPFIEANNLGPYITPELKDNLTRIDYRIGDAATIRSGYNAEILPRICNVYIDADNDGVLTSNQRPALEAARRVVSALAVVGITALVDEATGYEKTRSKNELQRLLDAYIQPEFRPWVHTFPEEFFTEIYRIHGWRFPSDNSNHRPLYVGKFINDYIYGEMPPGVLDRLREVNPKNSHGNRSRKHHQHLTNDRGVTHLENQIRKTLTLMQASENKQEFVNLFQKTKRREIPVQMMLEL